MYKMTLYIVGSGYICVEPGSGSILICPIFDQSHICIKDFFKVQI